MKTKINKKINSIKEDEEIKSLILLRSIYQHRLREIEFLLKNRK